MVAVVILLQVLAKRSKQVTNVRGFIMRSEEFFTAFNNNYRVNVSAGEKYNEPFWGDYFLRILEKKIKSNSRLGGRPRRRI